MVDEILTVPPPVRKLTDGEKQEVWKYWNDYRWLTITQISIRFEKKLNMTMDGSDMVDLMLAREGVDYYYARTTRTR